VIERKRERERRKREHEEEYTPQNTFRNNQKEDDRELAAWQKLLIK